MPTIRTSPRAIIRRGDLFLVVHYRDAGGDWFTFPGGGQQHGEDLHQALKREVEEEIGVQPLIGELRFVRECIAARTDGKRLPPDFHQVEVFFECTINQDPSPSGHIPDDHQIGIEWRTADDLRGRNFYPAPILPLLDEPKVKYLGVC